MKVIEDLYYPTFSKTKVISKSSHKPNNKNLFFTPSSCSRNNFFLKDNAEIFESIEEGTENIKKKHLSLPSSSPKKKNNEIRKTNTFDEKLDELVQAIKNKKMSNSSKTVRTYAIHNQKTVESKFEQIEKFKTFTNTENISDFYEYTENCIRLILNIKPKEKSVNPVFFNFEENPSKKKKIAVFDLDETLLHCTGQVKKDTHPNHIIQVTLPTKKLVSIGINIRPHWKEAMDLIKESYHIVTYTASHSSYADAVLNYLDPEKEYFKYRLYRNNCLEVKVDDKVIYVKDLDIFEGYNLKDIVIIDNSVLSFAYHLDNGIPIMPYYDSKEDNELIILAYYLLTIYKYDDLRHANKEHIKLDLYVSQAKEDLDKGYAVSSDEEEENKEEEKEKGKEESNNNVVIVEENGSVRRMWGRKKTQIGLCFKETIKDMHKKVLSK